MTATTTPIAAAPAVPEGYMQDAQGRLVPESMVKPIDKLRDQTVRHIVEQANHASAILGVFKRMAFSDIEAFIATSAEQYGVTTGGSKGNVTLMSFDGRYRVLRQVQESIAFDERLQTAKQLIDECITAWSVTARDEIKALINDAFQVDQVGQVNRNRVLGLQRLNIQDATWKRAMQAIQDSIAVVGSRSYVRVYERIGRTDQWRAISLDLASVGERVMSFTYCDLPGVKGGRLSGGMARSVHGFMVTLKTVRACSAADDFGAVMVWIDDAGLYRCEYQQQRRTIATALWTRKSELKAWLAEWLPKCHRPPAEQLQ